MRNSKVSGLCLEGFRRIKTILIVCMVIMLLIGVFVPMGYAQNYDSIVIGMSHASTIEGILVVASLIFIPLSIVVLFFGFFTRSGSDLFYSMPVNRKTIYLGFSLTSFLAVFLIQFSMLFAITITCLIDKNTGVDVLALLKMLLYCISADLYLEGAFLIGTVISGTIITQLFSSLIIIIGPRLVFYMFVNGLTLNNSVPDEYLFSEVNVNPVWNIILDYGRRNGNLAFIKSVIYGVVLGIVYFLIGYFVIEKRKSEIVSKPSVNGFMQSVLRFIPAFSISLLGTIYCLVQRMDIVSAIECYTFSLIALFLYEFITTRRAKNIKNCLVQIPILIVANVIIVFAMIGVQKKFNEFTVNMGQLDSVSIEGGDGYDVIYQEINGITDKSLKSEAGIRIIVDAFNQNLETQYWNERCYSMLVCFKQNGFNHYRYVHLTKNEYQNILLSELNEMDEAGQQDYLNKMLPEDVSMVSYDAILTNDENLKLYRSSKSEIKTCSDFIKIQNYDQSIYFIEFYNNDNEYMTYPISELTPKTFELYREILSEKQIDGISLKECEDLVKKGIDYTKEYDVELHLIFFGGDYGYNNTYWYLYDDSTKYHLMDLADACEKTDESQKTDCFLIIMGTYNSENSQRIFDKIYFDKNDEAVKEIKNLLDRY